MRHCGAAGGPLGQGLPQQARNDSTARHQRQHAHAAGKPSVNCKQLAVHSLRLNTATPARPASENVGSARCLQETLEACGAHNADSHPERV